MDEPAPGTWRVIDPHGNVVTTGTTIHMDMAGHVGEPGGGDPDDRDRPGDGVEDSE